MKKFVDTLDYTTLDGVKINLNGCGGQAPDDCPTYIRCTFWDIGRVTNSANERIAVTADHFFEERDHRKFEEFQRMFEAGVMLARQTKAIIIPTHSSWVGFNLLDRDDHLKRGRR